MNFCEFKVSMVYRVGFRTGSKTTEKSVSKKIKRERERNMPCRVGCFLEINTLHYRQCESPHFHSLHTRYLREIAAANM